MSAFPPFAFGASGFGNAAFGASQRLRMPPPPPLPAPPTPAPGGLAGSVLSLEYGGDFVLNQYGGLQMATGWTAARQGLERAILTNPATNLPGEGPLAADDLYHPNYGAGVSREVGEGVDADSLASIVAKTQASCATSPALDPTSPPIVSLTQTGFQQFLLGVQVMLANQTPGQLAFAIT